MKNNDIAKSIEQQFGEIIDIILQPVGGIKIIDKFI